MFTSDSSRCHRAASNWARWLWPPISSVRSRSTTTIETGRLTTSSRRSLRSGPVPRGRAAWRPSTTPSTTFWSIRRALVAARPRICVPALARISVPAASPRIRAVSTLFNWAASVVSGWHHFCPIRLLTFVVAGSGEHKAPSISSGVSHAVANGLGGFVYKPHQSKRYSNSSIFLENRDVLSDQTSIDPETPMHPYDYSTPPKIDYRHSGMLSDDLPIGCCTADCLGGPPPKEELRRYSDPKLKPGEADTVLDIDLPTSPLSPPAAYASRESYSHQHSQAIHRSYDRVDGVASRRPSEAQVDRSRLSFKSLPNLSSSCESLLQK